MKAFHVQSVTGYVLSNAYAAQPGFRAFLTARADPIRERGVELDIIE